MASIPIETPERSEAVAAARPIARPATLSKLDRSVVRLAILDGRKPRWCATMPGALARLGGERPIDRLADPKLEALRCYVRDHLIRSAGSRGIATARLRDAGYSTGQIDLVDRLLPESGSLEPVSGKGSWVLPAIGLLPFGWLFYVMGVEVQSWAISAMLTMSIALPVAPLIGRSA